jgi:hypothetical protein
MERWFCWFAQLEGTEGAIGSEHQEKALEVKKKLTKIIIIKLLIFIN